MDEKICSLQDWSSRCRRSTLFREACKTTTQSSLHVRWSETSFTRSTSSTLSAKLKLKLKPAWITMLSRQFLKKVKWCWYLDSLPQTRAACAAVELSNGISGTTWADDSQADESRIQDLVDSVIYPSNNWVPLPPSSFCISFLWTSRQFKVSYLDRPPPPLTSVKA